MEKKESKEIANLKLSYLDLFPSYEEIDENNEGIIILFQNCNLTYNLIELIKNREEIYVPQQMPNQTIKVNLLKSNNPYATGLFTVKSGEQWVTFTYDHKKKQTSNFALSLIDCIKIKFLCKIEYVPTLININNQLTNTEIQTGKNDSLLSNIITKPSPKKLYGNYTTKKSNHNNNNIEHDSLHTEESKISKMLDNINPEIKTSHTNNNLNNTTLNSSKNTNNPLLKSENLSEFINPLADSSGIIGKDFKNTEKNKNKNIKKIHNNNLKSNNSLNIENKKSNEIGSGKQNKKNKNNETLTREKTKISNNSLNNIANTIDNKNINESKSKQNLKRNKSKNLMDNKNKTNKKEKEKEKQIKNNTNNQNNSANIINSDERKSKKIKKDLSSKNLEKNKEEKEKVKKNEKKEIEENNKNINKDENIEDIHNNINLNENNKNEINENIDKNNEPILDEDNDELDNLGLDNFSKKLEDFQLLYNDEYIKSIKEEDFSLEIELYIEKLIELITEYHIQIEEKDLEYQLIKNMYHQNIEQYLEANKLLKKLELIKDDYNLKK